MIENLSFEQNFSYNKKHNKKLNNFKTTALALLKRNELNELSLSEKYILLIPLSSANQIFTLT